MRIICDKCMRYYNRGKIVNINSKYVCIHCLGDEIMQKPKKSKESKGIIRKIREKFKL